MDASGLVNTHALIEPECQVLIRLGALPAGGQASPWAGWRHWKEDQTSMHQSDILFENLQV